jgi:putative ABC transport system substrate-binding protein
MRRRDFISLIGSAAATWPIAARAQQPGGIRRVGVLMSAVADDPEWQTRVTALRQVLQQLGWTDGRNVRIDIRWAGGNVDDSRKYAAELVALAPDVILAVGGSVVGSLLQATRTVPIVFTHTPDPVGAGFVASLARPGGNATGFTSFEYGMSGKWLELLKEIAPRVTSAALLRDPATPQGLGQFGAIQSVAPSLGLEVSPVDVRDRMQPLHTFVGRAIVFVAALGTVFSLVGPAFAGKTAVPGPLVGAGLPGLIVVGGVYGAIWLRRKLRNRRSNG